MSIELDVTQHCCWYKLGTIKFKLCSFCLLYKSSCQTLMAVACLLSEINFWVNWQKNATKRSLKCTKSCKKQNKIKCTKSLSLSKKKIIVFNTNLFKNSSIDYQLYCPFRLSPVPFVTGLRHSLSISCFLVQDVLSSS